MLLLNVKLYNQQTIYIQYVLLVTAMLIIFPRETSQSKLKFSLKKPWKAFFRRDVYMLEIGNISNNMNFIEKRIFEFERKAKFLLESKARRFF